jgi:hypothetical protein
MPLDDAGALPALTASRLILPGEPLKVIANKEAVRK